LFPCGLSVLLFIWFSPTCKQASNNYYRWMDGWVGWDGSVQDGVWVIRQAVLDFVCCFTRVCVPRDKANGLGLWLWSGL
jgi:hypothetical protein